MAADEVGLFAPAWVLFFERLLAIAMADLVVCWWWCGGFVLFATELQPSPMAVLEKRSPAKISVGPQLIVQAPLPISPRLGNFRGPSIPLSINH
jgi:hypothetical protein